MTATRVAYLINQYPKVSHSFIRTEIQELERQGCTVLRLAMRGWDAELVDAQDVAERERTTYLLQGGAFALIGAFLSWVLSNPGGTFGALALATRMARRGERGLMIHLIYALEACVAARLVRKAGISHIHAHFGTNSTEVAMLAALIGGLTYSFTVHGPEEFDKPYQLKLGEKMRRAAFVVAITSFCKSQLFRFADLGDWAKIAIVHCGLGRDFLDQPLAPLAAEPRLLCVGRLCEQKGQLLLVRACSELVRRGTLVKLTLAGDGEMRGDLEREISKLGLGDIVDITGWVTAEQIRGLLINARALVLPSFAEGLPVVIMEAMAMGRPVISTTIAGIPELVRSGVDGVLVAPGDEAALADAMERLLHAEPAALHAMGASAQVRVRERHSSANEAAKLLALFGRSAAT